MSYEFKVADLEARFVKILRKAVEMGARRKECFAEFDADGDGRVTVLEMHAALRNLSNQFDSVTLEEVAELVRRFGSDDAHFSYADFLSETTKRGVETPQTIGQRRLGSDAADSPPSHVRRLALNQASVAAAPLSDQIDGLGGVPRSIVWFLHDQPATW